MSVRYTTTRTCDLCKSDIPSGAAFVHVDLTPRAKGDKVRVVEPVDLCEPCAKGTGVAALFTGETFDA